MPITAGSDALASDFVSTSAGAGDSGKVPKLNASGVLDKTFYPVIKFGDSSDGALVYDGSTTILGMAPSSSIYTLTRNIQATDLTINGGVTIKTNGYVIFASGTLLNNGIIKNIGGDGGAGGNTGSAPIQGTAGAATPAGFLLGGIDGVVGGSNNGIALANYFGSVGVAGGSSNSGSQCGGSHAGGSAGTGSAETGSVVFTPINALTDGSVVLGVISAMAYSSTNQFRLSASTGSGSGATGGVDFGNGHQGGGGGSGATGGVIEIIAKTITNNGTISANGGAGGRGGDAGSGAAGGGGGGGGSGGVIVLIYKALTAGTITATGGAGGGGGTGAGGNCNNGSAGATGNAGKIYKMQLD